MKTFVRVLLPPVLSTAFVVLAACSGDDAPPPPADAGKKPDSFQPPFVPDTGPPEDPDTGPPPTVLTSGEGFSMVYSSAIAEIGVKPSPNVQAFFDAKGGLTEFYVSDSETLSHGVTDIVGAGGDTIAGWGAWREGPTTGKWSGKADGRFSFGPGADFHYAVGRKSLSAAWPTSAKTYALAGGSAPTADGVPEPGTLTSATASCELGPTRTCTFTIAAGAAGGTIAISLVGAKIVTGSTGTASVSANDPKGGVTAMFAGDAAEEIILVYGGPLAGGTSAGKTLRGAAVLK